MINHKLMLTGAVCAALIAGAPALALNNPITVDLRAASGSARAASATIFGSGSSVLVNVTGERGAPKRAAITLNGGDCAKPGDVQFALAEFADHASFTQLNHTLAEVAGKATTMIIHETASATSPPFACGKLTG
jgi:hypothetical protein